MVIIKIIYERQPVKKVYRFQFSTKFIKITRKFVSMWCQWQQYTNKFHLHYVHILVNNSLKFILYIRGHLSNKDIFLLLKPLKGGLEKYSYYKNRIPCVQRCMSTRHPVRYLSVPTWQRTLCAVVEDVCRTECGPMSRYQTIPANLWCVWVLTIVCFIFALCLILWHFLHEIENPH